jgi:deoxyribodipyrimidine photo-lyase
MKRILDSSIGGTGIPATSTPIFETPLVQSSRLRMLNRISIKDEVKSDDNIILWMQRDQRVQHNYALLYANELAKTKQCGLKVIFAIEDNTQQTLRHFKFMIGGLCEVENTLREHAIPFHLLRGKTVDEIQAFISSHNCVALVTDFNPLRQFRSKCEQVASAATCPVVQVDAHNVVPCWDASDKLEYAARTIRPKLANKFSEFILPFPALEASYSPSSLPVKIDWNACLDSIVCDRSVDFTATMDCQPGTSAGEAMVQKFIESRLKDYDDKRNDPNCDAVSHLSPYFNFGQLSVQQVVMQLRLLKKHPSSVDSFVEEAVIRRELSDNFCFYNPNYDNLSACYSWAAETLRLHAADTRQYVYTLDELTNSKTHDDLWNAAQVQLVSTGKMHGNYSLCTPTLSGPTILTYAQGSSACTGPRKSWSGLVILRRPCRMPSS